MNPFTKNFTKELSRIRLSTDEKAAMRARLREAMRAQPAAGAAAPRLVRSPYPFFFAPRLALLALIGVLVAGTGGVAYAAQGALPGQPLYAVKINVNEQVESALAMTDVEKAQVHAELAERRLEEAQALTAQGALSTSTTEQLENNFTAHAAAAQTLTQTLAKSDPAAAAQISTELASSLAANNAVLVNLGDRSGNVETRHNSGTLAAVVRVRASAIALSGSDVLASTTSSAALAVNEGKGKGEAPAEKSAAPGPRPMMALSGPSSSVMVATNTAVSSSTQEASSTPAAPSDNPAAQIIAAHLEERAQVELAEAQGRFDSLKKSLDQETADRIAGQFASTTALIDRGSSEFGVQSYDEAIANFTQALQGAVLLNTGLRAAKNFNTGLLKVLFNSTADTDISDAKGAPTSTASTTAAHDEDTATTSAEGK